MRAMRWFGGIARAHLEDARVPVGCHVLHVGQHSLWTVGDWAPAELRTAVSPLRRVTVFGPCSATAAELTELATRGVDDDVLTAFAGCYTVVVSTSLATTVLTDLGHAWPIYLASTRAGTLWASSALALAGLTGTVCRQRLVGNRAAAAATP